MRYLSTILIALLLFPAALFAQAAPVIPASTDWGSIVVTFGSALISGLAVVLKYVTSRMAAQTKNDRWDGMILRLDDLTIKVARDVFQTYVKARKKASEDGTLTAEEKAEAKARAKKALKSYLGMKGLKEIATLMGGDSPLEDFLGTAIEDGVHRAKIVAKAVGSPAGPS